MTRMRVAVAGAGTLAKLFAEELPAAGHEVVILSRSHKEFFDRKPDVVEQRTTDYSSVPQLTEQLNDCDAAISTIADFSPAYVNAHTALIEACKQSPKCKRLIPSEFGGNAEDNPEPPDSVFHNRKVVKDTLKTQTEIEWTVVSLGWIMEYIVPSANRYHGNPGPMHPLDHHTKTITIPGTGNDVFSGEETTWLKMAETMKTVGGMSDLKVEFESVDELKQAFKLKESFFSGMVAEFKLMVPNGFCTLDQSKVQRDRDEFFPSLRFRTMEDMLTAAKKDPKAIV
ncbi:hypothetical protein PybrP1_006621 [[Pythium] brassicae (nom. inval.)]|nr:hypothetical protein PybrP1_006621 [[Pythium] brassicae (nom. inval.)]